MSNTLDIDAVYRLRFQRGLKLHPDRDYSIPRLQEIAFEMEACFIKIDELDSEIERMYMNKAAYEK